MKSGKVSRSKNLELQKTEKRSTKIPENVKMTCIMQQKRQG